MYTHKITQTHSAQNKSITALVCYMLVIYSFCFQQIVNADSLVIKVGDWDFKEGQSNWPAVSIEYIKPVLATNIALSGTKAFDFIYGGEETELAIGFLHNFDRIKYSAFYLGAGFTHIDTPVDGATSGYYLQAGHRWYQKDLMRHGLEIRIVDGKDIQQGDFSSKVGATHISYTYLFDVFK